MEARRSPVPTVDVIIEYGDGIVLVKRRYPPPGWAIPGGFVDYGESLEAAALREAREETDLHVELLRQFHTYSDPGRDARFHTITTVYIGRGSGELTAGDDAAEAAVFRRFSLPEPMAFDHGDILRDYFEGRY